MSSRGRRASFPVQSMSGDDACGDLAILVNGQDPRCFSVPVNDGGNYLVDLRLWGHSDFARSVSPLLHEYIRQMGPAPIRRTLYCRLLDLRRFWRFLDANETGIDSIDAVTVELVNQFEDWLVQTTPSSNTVRRIIGPLIQLLRVAIQLDNGRFSIELEHRVGWVCATASTRSRPRDAFSNCEAEALRAAARQQIRSAQDRLLPDGEMPAPRPDILAHPRLLGFYNDLIAAVDQEGAMPVRSRPFRLLKCGLQNNRLPNLSSETLHGALYLTARDVIAFQILLSLETGMEIECLRNLRVDCLQNPTRGYVEIEYIKRRARNSEWKRLRVRDGGSSTPGGLIRLTLKLTKRARRYLVTDDLWAFWDGRRLRARKTTHEAANAFAAHFGLVGDNGSTLKLLLSRLRKTHKAEHYLRTHGQLSDFAVGHSASVAANHYADIPALRHVHDQTIAEALQDALKPTLFDSSAEASETAEQGKKHQSTERPVVTDSDADVWLAHCSGFYSSPFGKQGVACPSPFWGCLECENAVISERKLPALIAFEYFMVEQREVLDAGEWARRFGQAYHRITAQILPKFPKETVTEARSLAMTAGEDLIYVPAEAR